MTREKKINFSQLPDNIAPTHYEIKIKPDIQNLYFEAEELINLNIKKPTNTITLNSLNLNIKEVIYKDAHNGSILSKDIKVQSSEETVSIIFQNNLPLGDSGHLKIIFSGNIQDNMKGLYRSKNISADGIESFVAVTQFEPIYARRCFPCWDEPDYKATFDIKLIILKGLTALSNMPVKSKEDVDTDLEMISFETSPVMSTYLVAIVIGEFDYVEKINDDGISFRVYTAKGKKEQGELALKVAVDVVSYYTSYFNIPYPLPKLDSVAIADFDAGAMENWGLVTYRETRLLFDKKKASTQQKIWIAIAAGHELAHQWFGNLVTMKWWTHLWLNEGYATFEEYLCVNDLFPEYDIWSLMFVNRYIRALKLDSLKTTHAIEVPVNNPAETQEIFDAISYDKGSCILRMLHAYIGDDFFRKGMHNYLDRFSYSNAQTEDLWVKLEQVSNKPVGDIMSTWTKQEGFPYITVEEKILENPNMRTVKITQKRFLSNGSEDERNTLWKIPFKISKISNLDKPVVDEIVESRSQEFQIEIPENEIIKINPGHVGFYRTFYSHDGINKFRPAIINQILPAIDRTCLLMDLFAFSQAGYTSTGHFLDFLIAYSQETNFAVWSNIINCLNEIGILISHLDIQKKYQEFGRKFLKNIYDKLGWETKDEDTASDILLRSLILNNMDKFEDPEMVQESNRRFDEYFEKKADLPADIRTPIYCAVLRSKNEEAFDKLMKLYNDTDLNEEQERILSCLGATDDEKLLKKALEFSVSEKVRTQDSIKVIMSVSQSYKGRLIAWEFFKNNYDLLLKRHGGTHMSLVVKPIMENFTTEDLAKQIEEFFLTNPTPIIDRTVKQVLETIRLKIKWLKRDGKSIMEFFETQTIE